MATLKIIKAEQGEGLEGYYLEDEKLSLKAKGLVTQLKLFADGTDFIMADFVHANSDGISTIRAAVRELKEAGYLFYWQSRNDLGQMLPATYYLYETPYDYDKSCYNDYENPTGNNDTELPDTQTEDYDEFQYDFDDDDGYEDIEPENDEIFEPISKIIYWITKKIALLEQTKEEADEDIVKSKAELIEVLTEAICIHKERLTD